MNDTTGVLKRRQFASYEDYVDVQRSKLGFVDLENHEPRFREALANRIAASRFVSKGACVLCLGARLGGEVRAFLDCGCFAVGIDLNPGDNNSVVLHGDFHQLVFPDQSVDVVFTNSLDHCFDLNQVCREVLRVLKPRACSLSKPIRAVATTRVFRRIPGQVCPGRALKTFRKRLSISGSNCSRDPPSSIPGVGSISSSVPHPHAKALEIIRIDRSSHV